MTRWPWLVLLLAGLIGTAWIGGSRTSRQTIAPVDSSRVDTIKVEVGVQDSSARHSLDSMRQAFKRRPIREVIRYLPGDTLWLEDTTDDTAHPMACIPEATIREAADSLATCRHDRDSTARQITLWQARTASQDEARRLCESRPAPIYIEPPSRTTWASIGAGVATTAITAIILITR
jgi:hypothetical protein